MNRMYNSSMYACMAGMDECCYCQMMMAMTMKGSVYRLIGDKHIKRRGYEKDNIYNGIVFWSWFEQQSLG